MDYGKRLKYSSKCTNLKQGEDVVIIWPDKKWSEGSRQYLPERRAKVSRVAKSNSNSAHVTLNGNYTVKITTMAIRRLSKGE